MSENLPTFDELIDEIRAAVRASDFALARQRHLEASIMLEARPVQLGKNNSTIRYREQLANIDALITSAERAVKPGRLKMTTLRLNRSGSPGDAARRSEDI